MKDSNEKEHRISNLKDLIDNVKEDNTVDSQEDNELINYLSEDNVDLDELEIDDEFIYHPDEDKDYVVNLEESPIDEDFIIKTPKEESKKGLTIEEIEDIEYKQAKLDNETIDDIFAEVEDIDEIPIISVDSEKEQ